MNIKNLFHRKRRVPVGSADRKPQPLRIEGIGPAPLTPEPDDAELAAQALLESMVNPHPASPRGGEKEASPSVDERGASYYHALADRIRQANEAATQRTLRFVAFVEQELQKPSLPVSGPGSLGLLEAELYKRLDVIERRGGELKKRWQHCLATVIVRRMQAEGNEDDNQSE